MKLMRIGTGAASGGIKLQCIAIATFSSFQWNHAHLCQSAVNATERHVHMCQSIYHACISLSHYPSCTRLSPVSVDWWFFIPLLTCLTSFLLLCFLCFFSPDVSEQLHLIAENVFYHLHTQHTCSCRLPLCVLYSLSLMRPYSLRKNTTVKSSQITTARSLSKMQSTVT